MEKNIQEIIKKIRALIAGGKLKKALEEALEAFPGDNEIIILSSRYNKLQRNVGIGVVSNPDNNLEYNNIISALLNKTDEIEKDNSNIHPMDSNKQKADVTPLVSNQANINGDRNTVIQENKGIININSQDKKGFHETVIKFMKKRHFDKAKTYLTKAINANPNYAPAYADRGMVRLKLEKPRDAIRDYETAVSLDPNSFKALHPLGVLYILDENIDKGCDCLKRAMEQGHHESEELYNEYCENQHNENHDTRK